MELKVLGSSSSGNCYLLEDDTTALIIECGVSFKVVKQALGFDTRKIAGVLVSHEHGDHSKYAKEYLDSRINVWMSVGTMKALNLVSRSFAPLLLESGCKASLGEFTVLPFDVKHDAAEPLGFLIHHKHCGTILFATDTYYLPYKFRGLNNIMIEANYGYDMLEERINSGTIPGRLRDRTLQSHMSLGTCKEALLANDLTKVNNIVLLHLSDGNSNADEFKREIAMATGKSVYVAEKGLTIPFDVTPF